MGRVLSRERQLGKQDGTGEDKKTLKHDIRIGPVLRQGTWPFRFPGQSGID